MPDESSQELRQNELLFLQLVMMFHGMAMQQLGKVKNPVTQELERDLGQAKNFIDLLSMMEEKTKGNLSDNEKRTLDHVLYELRLNYVDEVKKGDTPPEAEPPAEDPPGEESTGKEEAEG